MSVTRLLVGFNGAAYGSRCAGKRKCRFNMRFGLQSGCSSAWSKRGMMNMSMEEKDRVSRIRNIGIAAHIDSGKTTVTERILYYTGRIKEIHEVKGKDEIGAKMDSMELEREKGITIQSAATFCDWDREDSSGIKQKFHINLIDTPGHIDFTIEVERALRVLDGGVMIVCGVSGVQSQTLTVDRQMKRYEIPRITFINKMDRAGANAFTAIEQIRSKLGIAAAAVQIPIWRDGVEFAGVVDLLTGQSVYNKGKRGEIVVKNDEIPVDLQDLVREKRKRLIEELAEVDEEMCEVYLNDKEANMNDIAKAIRRATLQRKFTPVFMGSGLADQGIQSLIDGVCDYLPNALEAEHYAIRATNVKGTDGGLVSVEEKVRLWANEGEKFIGLAFKLEESGYGQLTYIRVYQGKISKGGYMYNVRTKKRVKIPRIVRMHSNEMEEVERVKGGEICGVFGIECESGDVFTGLDSGGGRGDEIKMMKSMNIPEAVVWLSIKVKDSKDEARFSRAINRFQKEDPTFRVKVDEESGETIISGMGELHLEIYIERIKREYKVECIVGRPEVSYRETLEGMAKFDYLYKKQTGGAGDYARVMGWIERVELDERERGEEEDVSKGEKGLPNEFENLVTGGAISEKYIWACERGFREACEKGPLTGAKVIGVRMVINDGAIHSVDSSEHAFQQATRLAFRKAFEQANPKILEPVMKLTVNGPSEYFGPMLSLLNKKNSIILDSQDVGGEFNLLAECRLNELFGFSRVLRATTQGKGEFTMEFSHYTPTTRQLQNELIEKYTKHK